MKNSKAVFRALEQRLTQAKWFNDDWEIYNRGEYLQLYKEGWHNENQGGIHFETYIEAREIREKAFPSVFTPKRTAPRKLDSFKSLWTSRVIASGAGKATRLWARATPSVYVRCR